MEFKLEVLIPLLVVLGISIVAVIITLCRFYVWKKVFPLKHQYSKLNPHPCYKPPISSDSKTPPFLFIQEQQQPSPFSNNSHETLDGSSSSGKTSTAPLSAPWKRTGPLSPYSDVSTTELFHFDENRSITSPGSEYDGNFPDLPTPKPGKLTKKMRKRFRSEPALSSHNNNASFGELKRKTKRAKSASKVITVVAPAYGQLQFSLYFDPEERTLTLQLSQLTGIVLLPESFVGLLDVIDRGAEHTNDKNLFLLRNSDGTIELSGCKTAGYSIYVTLLPKGNFQKQTNIIVGDVSAVFNEKFVIHGQTHEGLIDMHLCMHALCKLGRDSEPIVLGEIKVPLKHLQLGQILPFMANLELPEELIVLESQLCSTMELGSLEVYLSYNPMTQTLVVKIVQVTDLPKLRMTGNPSISVKMSLYYCNQRLSKKTTSIQRRHRDPVFNESFEFPVNKERLPECDVLFEIRHHGTMSRSIIGYVIVGHSAGGEGTKQWRQLLDFSYHEKNYKIKPSKPFGLS